MVAKVRDDSPQVKSLRPCVISALEPGLLTRGVAGQSASEWQAAMESLILVAESGRQ
jgi:hypothetical protein